MLTTSFIGLHSQQSSTGNRPRSGSMRRVAIALGVTRSPGKSKDLRKKSLLSMGRSRASSRAENTEAPLPNSPSRLQRNSTQPEETLSAQSAQRPISPEAESVFGDPVVPASPAIELPPASNNRN